MAMQITIIVHITDNRFILKCAYCKGTGRKYADDTKRCPQCNGSGAQPLVGSARIIG